MALHIKCVSICFGINSLMERSIKNSAHFPVFFFSRTHLHIIDKWQALIFLFHWHNLQIFSNFWARKWFQNYIDWFIARMLFGSMYHYSVTSWQLTTKRQKKQCERGNRNIYPDVCSASFDFEFDSTCCSFRIFRFATVFFPGRSSFYLFSAKFSGFLIDTVFHLATQQHIRTQYLWVLIFWKRGSLWAWNFIDVCVRVWAKKIQFRCSNTLYYDEREWEFTVKMRIVMRLFNQGNWVILNTATNCDAYNAHRFNELNLIYAAWVTDVFNYANYSIDKHSGQNNIHLMLSSNSSACYTIFIHCCQFKWHNV